MDSSAESAADKRPVLVLEPSTGWASLGLTDLWRHRDLAFLLAWREIRIRYAQTVLGALWAILQPLTTVLVFTVFFGKVAKISSEGMPYAVFSMAGLVPWNFFIGGFGRSSAGLLSASNLITKVYFPRLVLPVSFVLAAVPDMLLSLTTFVVLALIYGVPLSAGAALLPLYILFIGVTAVGFGSLVSALTVRYRDLQHVTGFVLQLWLFVTPVIYPLDYVTSRLERYGLPAWLYGLNPMAGVVGGFRSAALGTAAPPPEVLAMSALVSAIVLVGGLLVFRRVERTLADYI